MCFPFGKTTPRTLTLGILEPINAALYLPWLSGNKRIEGTPFFSAVADPVFSGTQALIVIIFLVFRFDFFSKEGVTMK